MTLLCRMHGGTPTPAILHTALFFHKQPRRLCVSADDFLPSGCQSCTAVFWGPSFRGARSAVAARAGVSTEYWGRSPRFGRGVSGNSSGSPSALLWPSECRARTASVGPILPTALKQRLRLPGPTAKNALLSPSSQADLEGISRYKRELLEFVTHLPRPCCCITSFLVSPAGPARGQVVDMRWLRAWATSRLRRTAGRAERGLC